LLPAAHERDEYTPHVRPPDEPDYYALLEVPATATAMDIRAAHKRILRQVHPDVNPDIDPRLAARINAAYEVLSDPAKRSAYDLRRRQRRPVASSRNDPEVRDARREAERQAEARTRRAQAEKPTAESMAADKARREAIERDKAAAKAKLDEQRAKLKETAAEREAARAAQRDRGETARSTAESINEERNARLRQRSRGTPSGKEAADLDAFRALLWNTLRDPIFLREIPSPRRDGNGSWQSSTRGLQWMAGNQAALVVPTSEIEWAIRQLWKTGRVSQLAMEEHFNRRHGDGDGRALGRALFTVLRQLPFFSVRPDPTWALLFDRAPWMTNPPWEINT